MEQLVISAAMDLIVYNDKLYVEMFVMHIHGEFDIFSKSDPSDHNEQYEIRSMETFDGKLMIGTATARAEEGAFMLIYHCHIKKQQDIVKILIIQI